MCDNEFSTYPSINKTCCTPNCAFLYKKKLSYDKYKKICVICNKEFLPPRQAEGGKFCSRDCSGFSCRKEKIERGGYWYVLSPDHPNSSKQGYVAEHRLIMEKHLGRFLGKDEEVHHKDYNKKNNSIENLQLLTRKDHGIITMRDRGPDIWKKVWTEEHRKKHIEWMKGNKLGKRKMNWKDLNDL